MNKKNVNSIESLEEYFNKCRKIRFDDNIKINSLDDVYLKLFGKHGTGDYNDKLENTYYKKGTLHCQAKNIWRDRYRSVNDFIILSKNYFPDKTTKEILTFLKEKEEELNSRELYYTFEYCPNIKKYNIRGVNSYNGFYGSKIPKYNLKDLFPNFNKKVEEIV